MLKRGLIILFVYVLDYHLMVTDGVFQAFDHCQIEIFLIEILHQVGLPLNYIIFVKIVMFINQLDCKVDSFFSVTHIGVVELVLQYVQCLGSYILDDVLQHPELSADVSHDGSYHGVSDDERASHPVHAEDTIDEGGEVRIVVAGLPWHVRGKRSVSRYIYFVIRLLQDALPFEVFRQRVNAHARDRHLSHYEETT